LVEHERKCLETVTYVCGECHEDVLVKVRIEHRRSTCMERVIECSNDCVRNLSLFCPILFTLLTFDTFIYFQYRLLSVK
jgi:hypothetical protein